MCIRDRYVSVGSWYHGRLGRAGAEDLLRDQEAGSYLVRESESKLGSFVLSYLGHNYKITHFRCVRVFGVYVCVVCVHHLHVYGVCICVCSAYIVQTFLSLTLYKSTAELSCDQLC